MCGVEGGKGGVMDIYFIFCVPIINHQTTQTTKELHTCHAGHVGVDVLK